MPMTEIIANNQRWTKRNLFQALCALMAAMFIGKFFIRLDGTEFSGGQITGPLLTLCLIGGCSMIAGAVLTFFYRRSSVGIITAAGVLSMLPCLYFMTPRLFRFVFRGEYAVSDPRMFSWDGPSVVVIVTVSLAIYFSLLNFFKRQK